MIERLISGGQTGADQGGLLAARLLGIPTGGYAPKGWRTEAGPQEEVLREFGLQESHSADYRTRTIMNIQEADATVVFAPKVDSAGTKLTIKMCELLRKPCLINPSATQLREWVAKGKFTCLNVAGNRLSVSPGVEALTRRTLLEALAGEDVPA